MLHETFTIELPYEELGIKQQGSATITTYIKDVFPKEIGRASCRERV